jgi:hypothetical protein
MKFRLKSSRFSGYVFIWKGKTEGYRYESGSSIFSSGAGLASDPSVLPERVSAEICQGQRAVDVLFVSGQEAV